MKSSIFSIGLMIILLSCEEQIDKPLTSITPDILVVEATLTNQKINHKIKLTHPYASLNGQATPATGASVFIFEGLAKTYNASEIPIGSGEYYTEELTAVFGKVYTLYIVYKGKEFFAQSGSVPVEPMNPLQYTQAGNGLYQLVLNESGSDPNYIDHTISWKNTVVCLPGEACEGRVVYYDLKSIDVNELFKPDSKEFLFPLNTIVIRRKYSVSPGYKSYLRSVLSETAWRGGVFDVQRANAKGNLSDGATGYFAVATVISDTTIIAP